MTTSLSEIPLLVQTLSGQIKQADADAAESQIQRDRAKAQFEREEATLARHLERGADLRRQLEALADQAQSHIRALGLPGALTGEGVILSSPSGSVFADFADAPDSGVQDRQDRQENGLDHAV